MTLMALRFLVGAILLAVGFSEGVSGELLSDDAIRDLLGRISIEELRASGMLSDLMALAEGEANGPAEVESTEEGDVEFDALDDDELLRQAMQMIED